MFHAILTVLDEFGTFPALINAEIERQLPFLATTKILMAAVKAGIGREVAHEVIKEHSVKATIAIRQGKANTFFDELAADSRIPLDRAALDQLIGQPLDFAGDAKQQVARVVNRVNAITAKFKEASKYAAESIR
jgi:adenylosuccinate lyase